MSGRVYVAEAWLHYGDGLMLYTAVSGPVEALQEIYLVVERNGAIAANAAVRVNIAYLTGASAAAAVADISAAVAEFDWSTDFAALLAGLPDRTRCRLATTTDILDCLLHDGLARQAGLPLAVWLGSPDTTAVATNQSLFWSDRETMLCQARRYVADGFRELKVRCGIGPFAEDLDRLRMLREAFGASVEISIDVNGRWSEAEALANFRVLEDLGLGYVEEPLPRHDWPGLKRLSERTSIPIMLDESLSSLAAVDELARSGAAQGAHLKLVKLGGIAPLVRAAKILRDAGLEIMVGQMNEGGLATAAAAHAALAVRADRRELYGAQSLLDDPAPGLRYEDGLLHLPGGPGLGLSVDPTKLATIWEKRI